MVFRNVYLVAFFLFLFTSNLFSQVKYTTSKWKSPILTIEVAGSYDLPIQESKGNVGDFFKFQNYGTSLGWGAQFNFKFGLGPQGQFRPYLTLGYAQLEGRDDNYAFIDSNRIAHGYPLKGSLLYDSTPGSSKIIIRNPYIGVGFEYALTTADRKKRSIIPFVGLEFLLDIVTGIYRQTPDVAKGNPEFNNLPVPFTIKSDVRMGLGAGIGADWRFTNIFGITFGLKYKIANLIGKKSDYLQEENKMNLLDEGVQDLNVNLTQDRNIAYMEFYLGASFFIGKTKK
jgi:opacity protein-like surface antigen